MHITIPPTHKIMESAYNMTLEEIRSKSDAPTLILLGILMIVSYLASLFGDDFDR